MLPSLLGGKVAFSLLGGEHLQSPVFCLHVPQLLTPSSLGAFRQFCLEMGAAKGTGE